MDSQPDEISPLSGKEILAQNVEEVVVMGGIFEISGMIFTEKPSK